jgi:putative flippase GtrA
MREFFVLVQQFVKFFVVGVSNTLVDLIVLNWLIWLFSISAGPGYSLFKAISFIIANLNSYFWNKKWTFKTARGDFRQFFVVSLVGLLVNVAAASFVVNFIGPQFGLTSKIWANVGALTGSVIGLLWNFLGYKFIVFK